MRCPVCGGPTQVISTRPCAEGFALRRRRKCLGKCRKRFTAYETAAGIKPRVKNVPGIGRAVHFAVGPYYGVDLPVPN
jgi:transcriptional regulator NrdR family protein